MSADVWNVCGFCPWAGTLCACVPAGMVMALLDGLAGRPVPAGGGGEREGEVSRGGHARRGLIADEPAQLGEGKELGRGAQIALVGEPLLIEGENVEHHRAGVDERDRVVVVVAGLERRQCRVI